MKTFNEKDLSKKNVKELTKIILDLQEQIKSSTSTSSAIELIIGESKDALTASEVKTRLQEEYGIELKHDNMLYNVVRNKGLKLARKDNSGSKSQQIIKLLEEGELSNTEIAEKVGTNYNYVIQVKSKMNGANEVTEEPKKGKEVAEEAK